MEWKKVTGAGGAVVIGLLLVCMAATPVSAEIGPMAVTVDGGSLLIDETGGIDCTASAGTWVGSYTPGVSYQIEVQCEYKDINEVIGQTANFRLEGPGGTVDTNSITDIPLLNNNWKGKLSVTFTPDSPGTYHWDISCNEGGKSASTRGDLILQ